MNEEKCAAHRNIFLLANPAFSVALNIYLDIQKRNIQPLIYN
jgi:hypothetical protein